MGGGNLQGRDCMRKKMRPVSRQYSWSWVHLSIVFKCFQVNISVWSRGSLGLLLKFKGKLAGRTSNICFNSLPYNGIIFLHGYLPIVNHWLYWSAIIGFRHSLLTSNNIFWKQSITLTHIWVVKSFSYNFTKLALPFFDTNAFFPLSWIIL